MRGKLLTYLFLINLVLGIPIIVLKLTGNESIFTILTLTTIIQTITNYYIIKNNLKDYNVDLLFLLSTSSVYLLSVYGIIIGEATYFHVTTILIIVYYITKLIEQRTYQGIEKTFSGLYELLPKKVRVIRNGTEKTIITKNLSEGDIVIIGSGKKIPVDGTIVSGGSCIDESMLTGESIGIDKKKGDKVIAGTMVVDGLIKVKVTKVGEDTYLSQVIDLIKNPDRADTTSKKRVIKSYKFLMILLFLTSITTFSVWKFLGESSYTSFQRAVNILVISSNASLVLATPISLIFTVTQLAKNGIIVKSPRSLETLPKINTYVFDKTGTLTEGTTSVKEIITLNGFDTNGVIKYILIAEKHSTHSIARLIYKQLRREESVPEPDHFKEYFGMGVYARYKGKKVHVGGEKFLDTFNIEKKGLGDLENCVVVCIDRKPAGIIKVEDTLKKSSKKLVKFLKNRGNEVIILTGDKKDRSKKIGDELGIKKVFPEVTPENKLKILKNLQSEEPLVMIGDGINDVPSLEQADIGISVNNEMDLIRESADIVLVRNDLELIEELITTSDFTQKKIEQNLFWTYSYNFFAVLIASGLFVGLGLSLNPLTACAASISSTLSIMINSFLFR